MAPMNILVTGSRGFLGTELCKRLRADGHKVIGWDLAHSSEPDEYRVDINNWDEMRSPDVHTQNLELIIHLAAEFGRKNGEMFTHRMWTTATIGTSNLIDIAKTVNCKLIFASSSEAYGSLADEHDVLKEDLLEHLAPNFHNEYALSKWCGERQVRMHLQNYLILRLFNIYGPTEPRHQYRSFVSRLCSGQDMQLYNGVRSHLFITDFLDAFCLLMDKQGVYNIGSPYPMPNSEVAILAGRKLMLRTNEKNNVFRKQPDISKLMSLGWQPKVSLEEGIRLCLESR